MKQEEKYGIIFLSADPGKRLKRIGGTELYQSAALAKNDSPENYEEVNEIWSPEILDIPSSEEELEEEFYLEPDEEGKISYDDAQKLIESMNKMKSRLISVQENNDLLTECLLEISQIVYES